MHYRTLSVDFVHIKKMCNLQSKHFQCTVVRNCAWFLSRHLNWTHQQQFFFLVSNFTFCFQSARLEPYKIEQEWNHMVLLPRPTLCTLTYTSRLLCMFFSSVNAFWTNLEIPALLSRGTVMEFLSIKNLDYNWLFIWRNCFMGPVYKFCSNFPISVVLNKFLPNIYFAFFLKK